LDEFGGAGVTDE
jgi:hypothetical protein